LEPTGKPDEPCFQNLCISHLDSAGVFSQSVETQARQLARPVLAIVADCLH
jgi:hypothetical protein